jgi:protein-glutamine gamma-glutamyltransferase
MTEATLLRASTVTAAGAGIMSLGVQGQLPPIVAMAALVLLLHAGAAPLRFRDGRALRVRRAVAKLVVLGGCLLSALLLLGVRLVTGLDDTELLMHQVGIVVALSLTVVLIAQLASADSRHELRVVLVASLLCSLVALGTAGEGGAQNLSSSLGFFLGLGWASALLSLWLLQRAKLRETAAFVHLGRVLGDGRHLGALVIGTTLISLASLVLLPHPGGWHPGGLDKPRGPSNLQESDDSDDQASSRSPQAYFASPLDLNARGRLPSERLASVPVGSPALWAGSVLDLYYGRYWAASNDRSTFFVLPKDSAGDYDLRTGAVPGAAPASAARSDTVRLLDPTVQLPVVAPGQAVSVRVDGRVVRQLGTTVTTVGTSAPPSSYVVRSNREIISPPTPEDVQLPETLPDRVGVLARRITRNALTTDAKIASIESYLHANEVYRLDSPRPAKGHDVVDDFLFESHEGFCEHFAAAEAVLLRTLGVPARLVSGFANGEMEGGRRVFRGTDAHAWVQVYLGGQEWVFSDPTAGATIAQNHQNRPQRIASVLVAHWKLIAGSAAVLLAILALGTWFVHRLQVRRARSRVLGLPPDERVLDAFSRLETVLHRVGLGRSPECSVQELAKSLRTPLLGRLPNPGEMAGAMIVVERVLYDVGSVPEDAALVAISTLDELALFFTDQGSFESDMVVTN